MANIKISELSIGDWVRHTFYEENLQIARIDGESERLVSTSRKAKEKGLMSVISHLDHYEPIPLTSEILEKNGFDKKNYDNGKMWDWWCDNVLVRKYADEDIYRFIVVLNSKHYTTTMVVGKHTHQLQHALRLAGVEKEIEV